MLSLYCLAEKVLRDQVLQLRVSRRQRFLVVPLVMGWFFQALPALLSADEGAPASEPVVAEAAQAIPATWSFIGFGVWGSITVDLTPDRVACPQAAPQQHAVTVPGMIQPSAVAVVTAGCPVWTLTCAGDVYCSMAISSEPFLEAPSVEAAPMESPSTETPPGKTPAAANVLAVGVYPAVAIRGQVAVPRAVELPDRVVVSGRVRPGRERVPGDPEFEFAATAKLDEDGKITFKAPNGTLDLRIAAEDLAPAYRWNVRPIEGTINLGRLLMVSGASLFGYVVAAETGLPVPGVIVTAIPAGIEHAPITDQEASRHTRSLSARSQERGFFQLTALTPGAYRLQAEHPDYLPVEPAEVQVVRDAETILRGDIVMSPPLALRVEIDPPVSPAGHRWKVALDSRVTRRQIETAQANAAGLAVFERLAPAEVTVRVDAEDVHRAFATDLDLVADHELIATLPVVQVLGHITLSDEPVQGTVILGRGDADGWIVELDEEGRFATWIQELKIESLLFLEVKGEGFGSPAIIAVEDAVVEDGKIEIEVNLLDLRVSGTVVSRNGTPVADASVRATQANRQVTRVRSKKDGSFALGPLQAGSYQISATQRGIGESQQEPAELAEHAPERDVRLVIRPSRWVKGTVVGPSGEPVVGALVGAWSVDRDYASSDAETDINGRFKLRVAPDSRQVVLTVSPHGYPFWSACLPSNEDIHVQLPAAGGWLDTFIDDSGDERRSRLGPHTLLVNDRGGLMPIQTSVTWSLQNGGGDAVGETGDPVFRVPSLTPGRWAMVWMATHLKDVIPRACTGSLMPATGWVHVVPGEGAQLTLELDS